MKTLTQYILEKQEEKIIESLIEFIDIKSKSELLNFLKEYNSDEKKKLVSGYSMRQSKKIQNLMPK